MAPKNDLILRTIDVTNVTVEPVRIEPRTEPEAAPIQPEGPQARAFAPGETSLERLGTPLVPTAFRNDLPKFGSGDTASYAPLSLTPLLGAAATLLSANPKAVEGFVASVSAYLEPVKIEVDPRELASIQESVRGKILSQLQSSSPRLSDRTWMDQRNTAVLHFDSDTGALLAGARAPRDRSVFSVAVRMDGGRNRIEFEPGTRENLESLIDDGMPPSLRNAIDALTALEGQPIVPPSHGERLSRPLSSGGDGSEIASKPSPEKIEENAARIFDMANRGVTMLFGGHFQSQVLSVQLRQGTIFLSANGDVMGGSTGMPTYASPRGRMRESGVMNGTPVDIVYGTSYHQGVLKPAILFLGADAVNPAQRGVLFGLMDRSAAERETILNDNPYLLDTILAGFGRHPHAAADFSRSFAATLDGLTDMGRRDFHGTVELAWSGDANSYIAIDPSNPYQSHYERVGAVRVDFDGRTKEVSASLQPGQPGARLDPATAEGLGRYLTWFADRMRQPYVHMR